jgi:HK97 gp10 family phage protein
MAGMFDMSVIGLEVLTDFMDVCDKNEAKLVRKATVAGARVILKAAKANCPVSADGNYNHEKGNLKKSLKMRVLKPVEKGKQLVLVGPETGKKAKNDGWYARFVENGTSHSEPKPFIRPAMDENQEKAYQEMARVYGENWGKTVTKDIDDLADVLVDALGG